MIELFQPCVEVILCSVNSDSLHKNIAENFPKLTITPVGRKHFNEIQGLALRTWFLVVERNLVLLSENGWRNLLRH